MTATGKALLASATAETLEQDAREEILAALWDGNSPTCEYYGPDDPYWNRAKRVCVKDNEQQADAYRTAVRAALLAEIVGAVERNDADAPIPELHGEMPDEMWETLREVVAQNDREVAIEFFRVIVRHTKQEYTEHLRGLAAGD
jgi:hypothetical protein